MAAINNMSCQKSFSILVIRVNANGEMLNAKPCMHCTEELRELRELRVKNIYHSDENGDIQLVRKRDLHSDFVSHGNR